MSCAALAALMGSTLLTACTPRPNTGAHELEVFLGALAERNSTVAAEHTDNSRNAEPQISATLSGLQAEGLAWSIDDIVANGDASTATVTYDWDLPGERRWKYTSTVRLSKGSKDWDIRWTPTALHPELGSGQHMELRSVPATRTTVVGSDGSALLQPGTAHRVLVDASDPAASESVRDIGQILDAARVTDKTIPKVVTNSQVEEVRGMTGNFSVTMLSTAHAERLRESLEELPAVSLNDEASMIRPDPSFAPDLMNRIESVISEDLTGANGWQVVAANADGAVMSTLTFTAAEERPKIDVSISKKVQDAAQAAVDSRKDAEVMMVAMRPSTGEILAMAQTEKADKRGDLAMSGQFPPGSVFKIITALAGVKYQKLNNGSIVPCPGTMEVGPRVVTNYNGQGGGNIPLQSAFARSCNTTFADIAYKLKDGELAETAAELGLGLDYKIPGFNTITGNVATEGTAAELIDAGYGQGLDLASPFGMTMVSSAVAAGKLPTPVLVSGQKTEVDRQPAALDPKQLAEVRNMMRAVVTGGTGGAIAGRGEVYAKTGEAEVNGGSHAWFTGYRGDLAFTTLIVLGGGSEHAVAVTDRFFGILDGDGTGDGTTEGQPTQ